MCVCVQCYFFQNVLIVFEEICTETNYDFVTIHQSNSNTGTEVSSFDGCDAYITPLVSDSAAATVRLRSDGSQEERGIKATMYCTEGRSVNNVPRDF